MKGLGKYLVIGAVGLGAILLFSGSSQANSENGSGSLGGSDSLNTGTDGLFGLTLNTIFPEAPIVTEPTLQNSTLSTSPSYSLMPFSENSQAVSVNGIITGFHDNAKGQSIPLANAISENPYTATNAGSTSTGTYNASTGIFVSSEGYGMSIAPQYVTQQNITNKNGVSVPNVFNLPVSVTGSSSSSKSSTPATTSKVTTPTTTASTKTTTPTTTTSSTPTKTASSYLGVTQNKYFKF